MSDEDYLAALLGLEEDAVPQIQARLAERLGISGAAVSEAVRRLASRGFIQGGDRSLQLTATGRKVAASVVRRHRLAECLLVDVLGLAWEKVHHEAARWQHIISAEVETRLVALLGDPARCPHGNPIPGCRSPGDQPQEFPLAAARPGPVRVARISERLQNDDEALRLLAQSDLIPGRGATVIDVSSETVTVSTPHGECVIPIPVAEQVWASSSKASPSTGSESKRARLEDQSAVEGVNVETVQRVFDVLQGPPTDSRSQWSSRYRRFAAQLQSGDPIALALACRDLWALKMTDTVGPGEDLLLQRAFRALTTAVGAALDIPGPEAQRRILEALA